MGTLIKNGTIITASDTVQADVLIEGEKVALIGQKLPSAGHQVIDAKGKVQLLAKDEIELQSGSAHVKIKSDHVAMGGSSVLVGE